MKVVFRKCTSDDLVALRKLALETFIDNYRHLNKADNFEAYLKKACGETQLLRELENPESDYYFVINREKIIGYFKLNTGNAQTENHSPDALEIERIYLLKAYQGKGLGRKMLNFTIDQAKARNKNMIWLGVWKKNEAAIEFYKKCGMVKFGEHIFQLGEDAQTDYLMKLEIQ